MKTIKFLGLPLLILIYMLISVPFQSCEPDDEEEETDTVKFYKPNIYIYPEVKMELTVKLEFPLGGKIDVSIPEYGKGWNVIVDTSGQINNIYSYLFYESTQPNVCQNKYGWTVKTDTIEFFLKNNMTEYGFNKQEINDFVDYWIPLLGEYSFYSIYPQEKDVLDKMVQLDFSKQPDNVLRLFYVFKGHSQMQNQLISPEIKDFQRVGYYVTEWGGVILK